MEDLKNIALRMNVYKYLNRIVISIQKTDPVTKYLLFSHISDHAGMSLATSSLLYFGIIYYIDSGKVNQIKDLPGSSGNLNGKVNQTESLPGSSDQNSNPESEPTRYFYFF